MLKQTVCDTASVDATQWNSICSVSLIPNGILRTRFSSRLRCCKSKVTRFQKSCAGWAGLWQIRAQLVIDSADLRAGRSSCPGIWPGLSEIKQKLSFYLQPNFAYLLEGQELIRAHNKGNIQIPLACCFLRGGTDGAPNVNSTATPQNHHSTSPRGLSVAAHPGRRKIDENTHVSMQSICSSLVILTRTQTTIRL